MCCFCVQLSRWPLSSFTPTTNTSNLWPKKRLSECFRALWAQNHGPFRTPQNSWLHVGTECLIRLVLFVSQWLSAVWYLPEERVRPVPTGGVQQGPQGNRSGWTPQTWRHQPGFIQHVETHNTNTPAWSNTAGQVQHSALLSSCAHMPEIWCQISPGSD